MEADVLIAGGGAAGLAAANVLARAGRRSIVVEGRSRLGGRLASVADARSPVPFELGAEFVHGRPEATLSRLRLAGFTTIDNGENGWSADADGVLQPQAGDPFATVADVLGAAAAGGGADESVERYLERVAPARDVAQWTRDLVAGFDAADPARASVRAISAEWTSDASAGGAQGRPLGGYATLVDALVRALDPSRVRLLTRHVLRALRSDADGVRAEVTRAHGVPLEVRARRAIVTLPLGVLQRTDADGVVFDPPLSASKRRALGSLVMGPVRKIVLLFATPFWETIAGGRFRDAAFFHQGPRAAAGTEPPSFPTFWTQVPLRAPFVVAWAGGPAAEALEDLGDDAAAQRALREFGALLGAVEAAGAAFLEAFTWNWQSDPFARGAYSYVATGGLDARRRLAEPEGRLAFAGEATAGDGEGGTVAGALLSGERAAREILAMSDGG